MKKAYLSILAIASLLQGKVLTSTEVEVTLWNTISDNTFQAMGNKINLGKMGEVSGLAPTFSMDLKTTHKNVPSIKIIYTGIGNDNTKTITTDINYNGSNFSKDEAVKTTYKADMLDAIIYSDVIAQTTGLDLDMGGGIRYIDSSLRLSTKSKESIASLDRLVPTLYTKVKYRFESYKAFVKGSIIASAIKGQYLDSRVAIGYNPAKNIDVELGYRYESLTAEVLDVKSDVVTKGIYISAIYTFTF